MLSKPIACGEYPQYANKDKQRKILFVLTEYRKTAQEIAKYQWSVFFLKGKFDRYVSLKHVQSKLSERYKQTCLWQVVSVLESWTSNLANRFRQIVINSNLPQERKKALLYLNSFKGWFLRRPPKDWITQEDMKLARIRSLSSSLNSLRYCSTFSLLGFFMLIPPYFIFTQGMKQSRLW